MTRREFHIKAYYCLALLIAFCLPLARFTPLFIALFFLNWLIEGDFKNKFILILKNRSALLFISLYVMFLLGLLYTENMDSGLFDIQVKLSLFVFPLIFCSRPLPRESIKPVFFSFITGGILSALIMLARAVYNSSHHIGENNFFYQEFSFLIHPSYLSMYYNLCITWLLLNILNRSVPKKKRSIIISFFIVAFFSVINVLLSSKLGLLTTMLLYFGFMIYFIVSRKRYLIGIAGMLLIILSVYSVIRFVPAIGDRVRNAIAAMSSSGTNQQEAESTAVRMLIWKAANQVIAQNLLLGTGTGDSKDELVKEYEKRGMTGALEHKLNTHNEFYQIFVAIGLVGFLLFIAGLLLPLGKAFKSSDVIYVLFLFILIFNFLPESMFETQAGVMFYAFFNSLFCFIPKQPQSTIITNN